MNTYRVTWTGCELPWYITADGVGSALAKVRLLRVDHRLPAGVKVEDAGR